MSKDTEVTAVAPHGVTTVLAEDGENVVGALQRLHREYVTSVRELVADGERRVHAALESCMSEMARIEDDASESIRKASTECESALRTASAAGSSATATHYWDYQRKVAEATTAAGTRAETARQAYLDAWKATAEGLETSRQKSRRDYVARVQQTWRAVDVEKLDPATVETLVQTFDAVFAEVAVG